MMYKQLSNTLKVEDPINDNERKLKIAFSHFKKAIKERKKKPGFIATILKRVFPNITRGIIEAYDGYLEHKKYQAARKKAVVRGFIRGQKELKRDVEVLIQEHVQQKLSHIKFTEDQQRQIEKAEALRKELAIQKERYSKIQLEIEKKQKLKEEKEKLELDLREKEYRQHAQDIRAQAKIFKKQKEKEEKIKNAQKLAKERIKKQKLEKQIKSKLPDVYKRQRIAEIQKYNLAEQIYYKKKEPELREKRLKYLIERYKSRPDVPFDFKRLRSDTQALANRKEAVEVKPLFSNPGYEDQSLMNDMRFKLQTALFEAGLHNTEYGRNVMTNMAPKAMPLPLS